MYVDIQLIRIADERGNADETRKPNAKRKARHKGTHAGIHSCQISGIGEFIRQKTD